MSQPTKHPKRAMPIKSAAVTDRGLSEKRPLNEDSFLADSERGIFAVADGVGGAEAGEVASQTAIEVLDEAFRHQTDGADIEDLMELAIQRANASIHQMSQEHAKFSMMATTIVGLHLDGNVATIGHVGDSRLYRLTPAGQLLRETEDHSVVEEEVRAGRMTAEQAANHPSKNVISRALGAENVVEVDMKIIEVDDGTEFLLCTDGITRHIPDHELRQLLLTHDDLTTVCGELKQRCYERGAEDNLTAVLVCVGTPISQKQRLEDLEKTFSPETEPFHVVANVESVPQTVVVTPPHAAAPLVPPSRKAFPSAPPETRKTSRSESRTETPERSLSHSTGGIERTMTRFFLFVLLLGALAAAFYGGRRYKGPIPYLDRNAETIPQSSPLPQEDALAQFQRKLASVDNLPEAWLGDPVKSELARQGIQTPLDSTDPEFLYFYGRARLLTASFEEAGKAFEKVIAKTDPHQSPLNGLIVKEAALGLAAVALKSEKDRPSAQTHLDELLRKASPPGSP